MKRGRTDIARYLTVVFLMGDRDYIASRPYMVSESFDSATNRDWNDGNYFKGATLNSANDVLRSDVGIGGISSPVGFFKGRPECDLQ